MADRHQWRFPYKLYRLLTHGQSGIALQWNTEGTGIKLRIQALQKLLSSTGSHPFKTQSVKSFIRQLHLYGFRRMPRKPQERAPLSSYDDKSSSEGVEAALEFYHPNFIRANPDFVDYVRRRTPLKKKCGHLNTTNKENSGKRKFLSSQDSQESFSSQSQGHASTFVEEQAYKADINSASASQSESHDSFSSGDDQNALSIQTSLEEIASVDFYPSSSLETFSQPGSPCYAVLQSLDSNVRNGTPLEESHSGVNEGNVLYPSNFQPWRSSTVCENLEELEMLVSQQQTTGHRVSPIFAWFACPTDIFSTETGEALGNLDACLMEEVEILTSI